MNKTKQYREKEKTRQRKTEQWITFWTQFAFPVVPLYLWLTKNSFEFSFFHRMKKAWKTSLRMFFCFTFVCKHNKYFTNFIPFIHLSFFLLLCFFSLSIFFLCSICVMPLSATKNQQTMLVAVSLWNPLVFYLDVHVAAYLSHASLWHRKCIAGKEQKPEAEVETFLLTLRVSMICTPTHSSAPHPV